MVTPSQVLGTNLELARSVLTTLAESHEFLKTFQKAAELVVGSLREGGRLYTAGNGGSAADSQHLAAELVGRLGRDRRALAAEALTVDSSTVTAIGNDYGFEFVFSRQVEAKATPRDTFFAISTSGNSRNIIRALETCKKMHIPSIALLGNSGGEARAHATLSLIVPEKNTSRIQEAHAVIYHSLCEWVETALCFTPPSRS